MHIPATRQAVRQARRALRQLGCRSLADDAQLALSELVGNSVRHAGLGPNELIQVAMDWSGTRLRGG